MASPLAARSRIPEAKAEVMAEYPEVLGVFSHKAKKSVGVGGTQAVHVQVTHWFVRQISEEHLEVQPINVYHVPSGMQEIVNIERFLREYSPEPNYYQVNTVPALKSLHDKILKGSEYLEENNLDAAEKEFIKALMIDEYNIDANYGLGEVYSEKNEMEKLAKVVRRLMGIEAAFTFEHTDRLNSFGVRLRRNGQLDQAAEFLEKAAAMNELDAHIKFNLARVYFDRKEADKCRAVLQAALENEPGFVEARKFLAYLDKNSPPPA